MGTFMLGNLKCTMFKTSVLLLLVVVLLAFTGNPIYGQQTSGNTDTFFLAKKKGLIGELAKTISTNSNDPEPIQKVNPFMAYSGKFIRSVRILRLGFERGINDTTKYNNNFGAIVANMLHNKTREKVINNTLFFKAGDLLNPYLLADNERFLRDQPYTQDALFKVEPADGNSEEVDIIVLSKDNFPIGGSFDLINSKKYKVELKNENISGSGSRLLIRTLYDTDRKPKIGYGAEFLNRNIKGSFINWTIGFQTFKNAFNSGRNEEATFYTLFEKPLVTAYIPWVGALELAYSKTSNAYKQDSIYLSDFKYSYNKIDGWYGYNFGTNGLRKTNLQSRQRKFIAIRGLYQQFTDLPLNVRRVFDYRYSDITGILGSFNIFEQNFYRTNFIYGFGRNEDVPQGFTAAVTAGITNKKDSISNNSRMRPYYSIEGTRTHFNKKGFFSTYTLRFGGFSYKGGLEDVDLLLNVDHFTRLKKINPTWYNRQFYSFGITRQLNPVLNQPLYLKSEFGLPYFNFVNINADFRATSKIETVFYNLRKFWGFRFAPFAFGDLCVIKPFNQSFKKSSVFGALGAGVRTRNENLIFGTIELKCFYFPKVVEGMSNWQVQVGSNIRFKYNSIFIKKPDFIIAN